MLKKTKLNTTITSTLDKKIIPDFEYPTSNVNRNYKDNLFRFIFKDKENLLSLYNAVNNSSHTNIDDMEITTLEDIVWINMKNDVSFIFDCNMHIYEHQSTECPNIPLRDLWYVSRLYSGIYNDKRIFSSTRLKIVEPKFVVFYNGKNTDIMNRDELCLSDLYKNKSDNPMLELRVKVLHIDTEKDYTIVKNCKMLDEYCQFVKKMRVYQKIMSNEDAAVRTIDECIEENILKDILLKHKAEVFEVVVKEISLEEYGELLKDDYYTKGIEVGRTETISKLKTLFQLLNNDNQPIDSQRIASDNDYLEELFKEYGL